MREEERRAASDHTARLQDIEIVVEGDFAERHDHAHVGKDFELSFEKRPAVPDFLGCGLVTGRRAAGGSGNEDVVERKSVVAVRADGAGGETIFVEGAI
jgi:hypothetical protein